MRCVNAVRHHRTPCHPSDLDIRQFKLHSFRALRICGQFQLSCTEDLVSIHRPMSHVPQKIPVRLCDHVVWTKSTPLNYAPSLTASEKRCCVPQKTSPYISRSNFSNIATHITFSLKSTTPTSELENSCIPTTHGTWSATGGRGNK